MGGCTEATAAHRDKSGGKAELQWLRAAGGNGANADPSKCSCGALEATLEHEARVRLLERTCYQLGGRAE